jgi:hypothetical protein
MYVHDPTDPETETASEYVPVVPQVPLASAAPTPKPSHTHTHEAATDHRRTPEAHRRARSSTALSFMERSFGPFGHCHSDC